MPKITPLGTNTLWKEEVSKVIRNRLNISGITPKVLFKKKAITQAVYYRRLNDAGKFTLQELINMERAGVKFTDEDILRMFGREGKVEK